MCEEIKYFGDLSLSDKIYIVGETTYNAQAIKKIAEDEDDRRCVNISVGGGVGYILPGDEYFFEDKSTGLKFTTDRNKYKEWISPFIEKQIKALRDKILLIEEDIRELESQLPIKK